MDNINKHSISSVVSEMQEHRDDEDTQWACIVSMVHPIADLTSGGPVRNAAAAELLRTGAYEEVLRAYRAFADNIYVVEGSLQLVRLGMETDPDSGVLSALAEMGWLDECMELVPNSAAEDSARRLAIFAVSAVLNYPSVSVLHQDKWLRAYEVMAARARERFVEPPPLQADQSDPSTHALLEVQLMLGAIGGMSKLSIAPVIVDAGAVELLHACLRWFNGVNTPAALMIYKDVARALRELSLVSGMCAAMELDALFSLLHALATAIRRYRTAFGQPLRDCIADIMAILPPMTAATKEEIQSSVLSRGSGIQQLAALNDLLECVEVVG
jgi:hypothetical protein